MKTMRAPLSKLRLLLLVSLLALGAWRAEAASVAVDLAATPPSENILFSFTGEENPDGWGWIGIPDEWRDMGMSFRSQQDGAIQSITLRIQKVPSDFLDKSGFVLRIYETQVLGETPESGKLIYSGKGELALTQNDRDSYIKLTLGENVPVASGALYTFILSWEAEAPFNYIVFHNNTGYRDGQVWYRPGRTGTEWSHLSQSDQPGLVFYVQESQSSQTPENKKP